MFTRIAGAAIGLVCFIVVSTVIFGSWYTVDQGEVGVLLRNGAVVGTSSAGLHFKVPWIEEVVKIETRQRRWSNRGGSAMEAYSKDLQPAQLFVTVNYSIDPSRAEDLYGNFGQNYEERVLAPAIFSAVKIAFGHYDAATAIANRGQMVAEMKQAIQASIGTPDIRIDAFQLENVEFSKEFFAAVEAKMQLEIQVQQRAQVLQQEIINANIVRTKAQAEADARVMNAKADAQQIELRGNAEALAIKARGDALKQNPGLVALTAAERWDGKLPATMVPNGALPFLNLQQAGAQ